MLLHIRIAKRTGRYNGSDGLLDLTGPRANHDCRVFRARRETASVLFLLSHLHCRKHRSRFAEKIRGTVGTSMPPECGEQRNRGPFKWCCCRHGNFRRPRHLHWIFPVRVDTRASQRPNYGRFDQPVRLLAVDILVSDHLFLIFFLGNGALLSRDVSQGGWRWINSTTQVQQVSDKFLAWTKTGKGRDPY